MKILEEREPDILLSETINVQIKKHEGSKYLSTFMISPENRDALRIAHFQGH